MKKIMIAAGMSGLLLAGCASSENQMREAIRKNPKIVFDAIDENPEQFIEVVNRAAQKAQQIQNEKRVSEMKLEQEKDLKNPKQPKLSADRRLAGNDKGKIVIVEYADFQCPACRMGYDSLKKFKEKHKDQVQFYYKNMPLDFHKMAYPSALYFEAVRLQDQAKAQKFYDFVFQNQNQLNDALLKKAVQQAGANLKQVEADMKSEKVKKIVEEDMSEFQNFGFTGTPAMIINGVALSGAQPLEELERIAQLTQK